MYSFFRCYSQFKGQKFVRMVSKTFLPRLIPLPPPCLASLLHLHLTTPPPALSPPPTPQYSETYQLLTAGIEGSCVLSDDDDQFYCGVQPGQTGGCVLSCEAPFSQA